MGAWWWAGAPGCSDPPGYKNDPLPRPPPSAACCPLPWSAGTFLVGLREIMWSFKPRGIILPFTEIMKYAKLVKGPVYELRHMRCGLCGCAYLIWKCGSNTWAVCPAADSRTCAAARSCQLSPASWRYHPATPPPIAIRTWEKRKEIHNCIN